MEQYSYIGETPGVGVPLPPRPAPLGQTSTDLVRLPGSHMYEDPSRPGEMPTVLGAAGPSPLTLLPWLMGLVGGGGIVGGALTVASALFSENGGAEMTMGQDVGLYGRSGVVGNGGGVPVGGPGVPEPPASMVAHYWKIMAYSPKAGLVGIGNNFYVHHWRLIDGRRMSFNPLKNQWKMWRPTKPLAVMYRGKTSLSQAVKVQRYLDRMWKTVAKKTKAVKLA